MQTIGNLLLFWIVLGTPLLATPALAQDNAGTDYHLFLLVGQSNMAGRGKVADQDRQPHPRVVMLDQAGQWQPATDPLHFDKPKAVGVGPGRSFALAYVEAHPNVTVGLIPCAVGGSPIDAWQPGAFYPPTDSHPYDDALARTRTALAAGTLKGILWHQGESDATAELSPPYANKLTELIQRFRRELNAPDVPFLIGQLGQFAENPWTVHKSFVDQVHRHTPRYVPNVAFASSRGLQHMGDKVHFESAAARELGRRYYAAWEWLQEKQPVLQLPPGPNNPRNSEGDFIQLKNGNVQFIYTRFMSGSGDHDQAQLVSRTSTDAGVTWSTTDQVVLSNEGEWNVMSISTLRLADGRLAMFYLRKNSLEDCRPWLRFSSDEGQSWGPPTEIIPEADRGYYILNNDRVVQLSSGRIMVPVALHNRPGQASPDWAGQITCYFSDDAGSTWKRSQTLQTAAGPGGERIMAQEPGIVELSDGRLMMWIRTNAGHQYRAYSDDQGVSWGAFAPLALASPRSPASIERIPTTGDLLAVWNDHAPLPVADRKERTPLCYALSSDDGETWSESQVLAGDPEGFYCYTAIDFVDQHVLLGHGAGKQQPGQHLSTTTIRRVSLASLYQRAGVPRLVKVSRIWDKKKHNAFTDLVRFKDQWFCVFREATSHTSPDGELRIITSHDGVQWTSAALITWPHADLRDAKLTITPDQRLMLSGAGAQHDSSQFKHQSLSWFSEDGHQWSEGHPVGQRDNWLWRTTWHNGISYGVGYATHKPERRLVKLFHSRDGIKYDVLVESLFSADYPNESSLVFDANETAWCLLRRDAGSKTGQLGMSLPPYTQWQWQDLGVRIGGPHMLQIPDGRFIAAARLYAGGVRTALCWVEPGWLDPDKAELREFITLPSGGDTSYAGLAWHDDQLWVSYYSGHEASEQFTTAIYFAQVDLGL
jgi:sialidase-1